MLDAPAATDDRRRNDVTPVDDGGGAGDQDHLRAVLKRFGNLRREGVLAMRSAMLRDERAAERREAGARRLRRLVEDAVLEAGEARLDERHAMRLEWHHRDQRPALRYGATARLDGGAGDGEGNDLDRRHHLLRRHYGVGRHGREG